MARNLADRRVAARSLPALAVGGPKAAVKSLAAKRAVVRKAAERNRTVMLAVSVANVSHVASGWRSEWNELRIHCVRSGRVPLGKSAMKQIAPNELNRKRVTGNNASKRIEIPQQMPSPRLNKQKQQQGQPRKKLLPETRLHKIRPRQLKNRLLGRKEREMLRPVKH